MVVNAPQNPMVRPPRSSGEMTAEPVANRMMKASRNEPARLIASVPVGKVPPRDLVIFPETVTSGYFVEGGVRDVAVTAGTLFRDLTVEHEAAAAPPIDVAVGFYEVFQNHFYNSCLYASLGNASPGNASSGNASPGVRHVHRKVFLPTYGVFDEERFVDRGREIRAFDTHWGRAAILVCEDAWHSISGTIAALQGAQLVIVPS